MILTHYGSSMRPEALMQQAASIADQLGEQFFSKNDKIVLFYCGMSGVASATALVTLISFINNSGAVYSIDGVNTILLPTISAMVYVRKKDEKSHGDWVEISVIDEFKDTDRIIPVFIDDFVCEGRSFKFVKKQVANYVRLNDGLFKTDLANCEKFFDKLSRKKNWWIAQVDRKTLKRASEVEMYA